MKFLLCDKCGNFVYSIRDSGMKIICCGQPMTELQPKQSDTGAEKHVPVCNVNGNKLQVVVGEIKHPMTKEHLIEWILVKNGNIETKINFTENDMPVADVVVDTSKPIEVYCYCNLHGLWLTKI